MSNCTNDNINTLFEKPLPSARNGAFFNSFPYPTKISPESIGVYIAAATKPGDTILDTFSGSGSTGIAALLCECPTEKMIQLANNLGVNPNWGPRNAIGYELGTYGSFAAKTISNRLASDVYKEAVKKYIDLETETLGKYYSAIDPNGNIGTIRYIIWSEILVCPKCGKEISYFDYGTKRNPVRFNKDIVCPHCLNKETIDKIPFQTEEYYDGFLKRKIIRKKRLPVWVYGVTNGHNWDRPVIEDDFKRLNTIELELNELKDSPKEIVWGDLHRKGYHFGISHLHHFYTVRNYLIMHKLWDDTNNYDENIRDALRLLLLSYNASHCTLMTRVVAKKNAKDFVLTSAQSGVLYISKLPVEKNIFMGLERKSTPFYEAYKLLENCKGNFIVKNKTSQILDESNNTIDFVFTDPPFGDFIPYAEVNQINELWLEKTTVRNNEIIISPSQNKGINDYQHMLTTVFSEIKRVLKDSSYAAVVFHAAKAKVWVAFETAINDAGLNVELTSILDKKQSSFKQVVSNDSVQGDPLVLLSKNNNENNIVEGEEEVLRKVLILLNDEPEFDERRAYSLYVNECLQNKIQITYDAKRLYALIRELKGSNPNEG